MSTTAESSRGGARRRGVLAAAAVVAALLGACAERRITSVVLVTMESVRAGETSAGHGGWATTDTTPSGFRTSPMPPFPEDLDDFARVGVRFANAFAPSGSALATLVALHTGRPPEEAGVYSDRDRLRHVPTLAERLSLRGVRCGAFLGRPALGPPSGLERGFASFFVGANDISVIGEARVWAESVRLLEPDRPLFVWIHLAGPRPPFEPMGAFQRVVAPGVDPTLGSLASLEAMARSGEPLSVETLRAVAALHAAEVRQASAVAKEALLALRPILRDFRETLILFAGTNGEELGERGTFGSRRTLRDATLHVPLFLWKHGVFRYPRVASPVVTHYDLAATIARSLGSEPPDRCAGRSLFEILESPGDGETVAFASLENRIFTVRSATGRLVCNPVPWEPDGWPEGAVAADREQLYDLTVDPRERIDRAGEPSELRERLRALLVRARASCRPREPVVETDPARLAKLAAEGTHGGESHPPGAPPSATCGDRP